MNIDHNIQIPLEVANAAAIIEKWTKENELTYWEMGGLCDRKFAFKLEVVTHEASMMLEAHDAVGRVPELAFQNWMKQLRLSIKEYKQKRGISN